jgi:hypothetical protein
MVAKSSGNICLQKLELMMIESRTGNDLAVSLWVKKFHFYP